MKHFLFVLMLCASGLLYGANTQTVTQTTTTQTQVTNHQPTAWDNFKQSFGMGAFATAISACGLAYGGAWYFNSMQPIESVGMVKDKLAALLRSNAGLIGADIIAELKDKGASLVPNDLAIPVIHGVSDRLFTPILSMFKPKLIAPIALWKPSTIFSSIAVPLIGGVMLGKSAEKAHIAGLVTSAVAGIALAFGLPKLQTAILAIK